LPAAHAKRNGVQRVVVEDRPFDCGQAFTAVDSEAVAAREPVGGDRAELVERLRAQRLECDLVSLLRVAASSACPETRTAKQARQIRGEKHEACQFPSYLNEMSRRTR
jgi:hypothetical protein